MTMDHYSKSPTAVIVSEGTSFAQTGKKKKGDKDKPKTTDKDPKELSSICRMSACRFCAQMATFCVVSGDMSRHVSVMSQT